MALTNCGAQHGCTFHIAMDGEMLRLNDIHVQDDGSGEWRRPTCSGEVPPQAALYQQVPFLAIWRCASASCDHGACIDAGPRCSPAGASAFRPLQVMMVC